MMDEKIFEETEAKGQVDAAHLTARPHVLFIDDTPYYVRDIQHLKGSTRFTGWIVNGAWEIIFDLTKRTHGYDRQRPFKTFEAVPVPARMEDKHYNDVIDWACAALKLFKDAKPEASPVTRGQEVGWVLKALKQWEQDTGSIRASVTESNAFIDGFMEGLRAGREEKS